MILKYLKYLFLLFQIFIFGKQISYAKIDLVLPQNNVSFSTEKTQSFTSLEKDELHISSVFHSVDSKIKDNIPAEDLRKYIDGDYVEYQLAKKVADAGDDFVEGLVNGVRRYNIGKEIAAGATTITRKITNNGKTITLKWTVDAKGKISFGNRSDLAKILGTVEDEAHHILTWTKSGEHSVVQAAAKDGFHLNTFENGIGLSKYRKSLGEGMHGNHPAYDKFVVYRLDEYKADIPNFTSKQANEFIQKELIPEMKDLIDAVMYQKWSYA